MSVKVSVVVPVFNVEKYLERCLQSLVNQTLAEIEIIVVNDGSEDRSQQILDRFTDKYPTKIKAIWKKNGGLSDARNYGLACCSGDYIGFLDSDDYAEPDMFERLYLEARKTDADIVICDFFLDYAKKTTVVKERLYASANDVLVHGTTVVWNKIYKRELVEKNRINFPVGLLYEDIEFLLKAIPYVKRFAYVPYPLMHYMQRAGSLSNGNAAGIEDVFAVLDHIYAYYDENGFYPVDRQALEYFSCRVLFLGISKGILRCPQKELRKSLLLRTLQYLDTRNDRWRKNVYLNKISLKNLFMKSLRRWNIVPVYEIARHTEIL